MTLTVPIINKLSLNKIYGGIHFRTRSKHKTEYRELLWSMQPQPYQGKYPVHITYDFQFQGRRFDSSNCAYLVKLIEDALVNENVIPDDSPKYVHSTTMTTNAGNNEVVISIKPV